MTAVHIVLGIAVVAFNVAAGAYGAWGWWRHADTPGFWPLLRAAQALVVLEAVLGGVLLLAGKDLPPLHLVYGLTPLAVAFFAEQLRRRVRAGRARPARPGGPRTRSPPCRRPSSASWCERSCAGKSA